MSDATGLDWDAQCPVHGLGTQEYEAVLKPRFEEQARELAEMQAWLRERRDAARSPVPTQRYPRDPRDG
jgi:hypothetical protein